MEMVGNRIFTLTNGKRSRLRRLKNECLRPTPANNLPVLAGIQLAELRHKGATLSLARRAMEPGHLLHSALTCPSSANARRFKSRHPFVPAAQQLIRSPMECGVGGQHYETLYFHSRHPPSWNDPSENNVVLLNRLRTGVGRFAPACTNGV